MEIFNPLIQLINFVGSIFNIIKDAIEGIIAIVNSIISLAISITRLIPYPLYPCFLTFSSIYLSILIYKVIRKG